MIGNIQENIFRYNLDIDVGNVHETALRILEELGIFIGSAKALEFYESLGCKADFKKMTVKIPESLIAGSLKSIQAQHKLFNRDGSSHVIYGGSNILLTSGAAAIRIRDMDGNYRNATLSDLEKFTRLHDSFEMIDIVHTAVDATDLAQETMRAVMAAAVFKNTSKSAWFVASKPGAVECIYNMALAIRGSKEDLDRRPFFRIGASPESVLGYQKDEIELLMKCAELGIPTGCEAYPIMGLTAPLSITGALAITAANYLAALVIKKAIDPDNRDVFPVMAGSFNMKNGEIITSSPEIWQYYIAGIKLARHYNIPSFVLAASDAKDLDIQAVFEKAAAFFISSGAGVNNIFAATNDLDAMNLAVYEGAVIELEILSALSGFLKNLKVPGPGIDFEIIRSGLENKMFFLEESHTISNFREFIWNTDIFIKDNYLSWKKTGMKKIAEIASRKAKDILSTHEPVRLPVETIREIDRIIDSYAKSVNNR